MKIDANNYSDKNKTSVGAITQNSLRALNLRRNSNLSLHRTKGVAPRHRYPVCVCSSRGIQCTLSGNSNSCFFWRIAIDT